MPFRFWVLQSFDFVDSQGKGEKCKRKKGVIDERMLISTAFYRELMANVMVFFTLYGILCIRLILGPIYLVVLCRLFPCNYSCIGDDLSAVW